MDTNLTYPGTIFTYEDQSDIQPLPIEQPLVRPVFMTAITSDKGPEDYRVVSGEDFFKLYGKSISFTKHGQPLLQAAAIINAGGSLFVKRVVAPDAALANIAVIANVASTPTVDEETGASTPGCTITYKVVSVAKTGSGAAEQPAKSMTDFKNSVDSMTVGTAEAGGDFPLFIIADNGRGVSNKNFQIVPDYSSSKNVDYVRYMFNIIENNSNLESIQFGFDPNTIDNGVNVSLESRLKTNSAQVECVQYDDNMSLFIKAVANLSGVEESVLKQSDILFGADKKGNVLPGIKVDLNATSTTDITYANISSTSGIGLLNGSNGSFGDRPINAAGLEAELVKVFNGGFGNSIYDLDSYKIDAIVDANYPASVKRAIETFVTFREDCFYFRDLGLGLSTLEAIKFADTNSAKNKFCASYCNSYDIIDPYSLKQITVTIGYSIAKLLVSHFNNGRNRPFAGQLYNIVLSDAVEGTVNFLPAVTPTVNEKEELGDARINYVSLYDGVPVLETLYTSQEKHSQFSYLNNILAIQEVIKAIRTRCPKIRYSFIEGDDLEEYKKDVESVIENYANNFMSITMEYIADPVYISNKIFYAAIKVKFKNFVQTEYFKVIALPTA